MKVSSYLSFTGVVMPRGKKKRLQSRVIPVRQQPREFARRKQWTDESMLAAMEAAKKGTMSINKAAVLHGVPPTTLKDRLSGKVVHGTAPGPKQYLSAEEEAELASHLVEVAQVGYGKTRKQVMHIAEQVARDKSILRGDRISSGWWRRFTDRQPQLSLRRGDVTAHVRMDATSKQTLRKYYKLLSETLAKYGITNSPAQVYNMDETGIPLDPRSPNIVVKYNVAKKRYDIVFRARKNRCLYWVVPMPLARRSPLW